MCNSEISRSPLIMSSVCKPILLCVAGVQVILREYDFSSFPVFTEDDIASVYPIVKHTDFRVKGFFPLNLSQDLRAIFLLCSRLSPWHCLKWHNPSLPLVRKNKHLVFLGEYFIFPPLQATFVWPMICLWRQCSCLSRCMVPCTSTLPTAIGRSWEQFSASLGQWPMSSLSTYISVHAT